MARLLHSLVVRNHLHVDDAELHCECRVGTKLVIEEYIAEMTRALEWLGESDAMGPEEKVRTAAAWAVGRRPEGWGFDSQ